MRGRRDENHKAIVKGLRDYGATVLDLGDVGKGAPDLLVGFRGRNWLIEVKADSRSRLSEGQRSWHAKWKGNVCTCHNLAMAINRITQCP